MRGVRDPGLRRGIFISTFVTLSLLSVVFSELFPSPAMPEKNPSVPAANQAGHDVFDAYRSMGGYFIENRGQVADGIRYYSMGNPSVGIRDDGVMFAFRESNGRESEKGWRGPNDASAVIDEATAVRSFAYMLRFEGANDVTPIGVDRLPFNSNFFIGNNSDKWRTNVPNYREIVYENLYTGIDLAYLMTREGPKYEFRLQPYADPEMIRQTYDNVETVEAGSDGLTVRTGIGDVHDSRPYSFQASGTSVACEFSKIGPLSVGFACPDYDESKPLTIDPLVYSTFIGGSYSETGFDIATDSNGYAYVSGETDSPDFPAKPGSYDTILNSGEDAFVVKLSSTGSTLTYATFLGGTAGEEGYSISVDSTGNAFVSGSTYSSDFPTTPGAVDTVYGGDLDVYVTKLNPAGNALIYSTYLGGSSGNNGLGSAVDSSGNAYVVGSTNSVDFPVTPGAYDTSPNGLRDAFLVKLNPTGSARLYSTLIGGLYDDGGWDVYVDANRDAYVVGETVSDNFPTTPGAYDRIYAGYRDTFVLKLNDMGTALIYSTLLGGRLEDVGVGISVDSIGNAYVTGVTLSPDFPATPDAFDKSFEDRDCFVTGVNTAGTDLIFSTFLGGSDVDACMSISVEPDGTSYVTGHTESMDFPATPDAFDKTLSLQDDAMLSKFNNVGNVLVYSTYLGGIGSDWGWSVIAGNPGDVYLTGETSSSDFPTTPGAFDRVQNGTWDAFVMKFSTPPAPNLPDLAIQPPDITFNPPSPVDLGTPVTITAVAHNLGPGNAAGVVVAFFDGAPGLNQIGLNQTIPFIAGNGGTASASVVWDAPSEGMHAVFAVLDLADTITELDETNNQACESLEIIRPPLPDLSVPPLDISIFPPSPLTEGMLITVNATIRNVGAGVSDAATARVHDGQPPSPQIGSDQPLPPIPAGGAENVTVAWVASPSGSHEICVVADPDNIVAELNETNNMACVPVQVLSLPDLLPSIDVTPPPPVPAGSVVRLNVTVENTGDLPAAGFDVLLFSDLNGNGLPDAGENIVTNIWSLAGHSQSSSFFDWTATPPGSHRLCAYADPPPGIVAESNENNNVACVDILVQPGPPTRPDYVPIFPQPPSPIRVGLSSPVSLSIIVHNQGNGTATADATLAFYNESSPPFTAFIISPVAPAISSSMFTATWVSPATPGTYRVIADVDHDSDITEWDEANNLYIWTIEVVAGPITSLVIGNPNYTATVTYVKSSTPLDLTVIDQSGKGIINTTYRIDGGDWRNYTATGAFFMAGEGQHEIEWYSIDRAGNVEGITATNITVDDAPPATVISPAEDEVASGTLFTFTATDTGCGVNITMYRVDGGDPVLYVGGFTLSQGVHDIYYYSVDNLGNAEAENHILVTVRGPFEVAVNYKPLVALIFAIILLVAGVWSSRRRPWKGGKDKMAVIKAFMITSLPFVLAEAGTGIVSLLTGQLSIPPLVEVGTFIDLSILIAGMCAVLLRARRPVSLAANGDGDADG